MRHLLSLFVLLFVFNVEHQNCQAYNDLTYGEYLTVEKVEIQTVLTNNLQGGETVPYFTQAIYYRWYERLGWYAVEYEMLRDKAKGKYSIVKKGSYYYLYFIDKKGYGRRIKTPEPISITRGFIDHEQRSLNKYPNLVRIPYFKDKAGAVHDIPPTYSYLTIEK